MKLLNHIDEYYKNYNIVSHINIYMTISLISIVVLSMLLLYFTDDYFKINIRKIIINKEINKKFKVNKKIDRY
ncbi:MAG: hypothetical protein K0R06_1991, partial [Clostridium sp.]|nr:hypothetical protein [Clostridium sp.]